MPNPRRALSLLKFFYHQRVTGFSVPYDPHFDPVSTPTFLELLKASRLYLEFGSGGSTRLADRLGIETISIETDACYAAAVTAALGRTNRNRMFVAPVGPTVEWGYPIFTRPSPDRVARWRRYIDRPFELLKAELPGRFPDLILVDGRFRRACALRSAYEAQAAGAKSLIFFDDYIDRPWYHSVEEQLGRPRMVGRAALFETDAATARINPELIDEAILDLR